MAFSFGDILALNDCIFFLHYLESYFFLILLLIFFFWTNPLAQSGEDERVDDQIIKVTNIINTFKS